jgi:hypothetical protein
MISILKKSPYYYELHKRMNRIMISKKLTGKQILTII